jgi:hypothetical protein
MLCGRVAGIVVYVFLWIGYVLRHLVGYLFGIVDFVGLRIGESQRG